MALSDDAALLAENTTGAISATDVLSVFQSVWTSLGDSDDATADWESYAADAVTTHSSDSTSVHGISDTSALLVDGDVIDEDDMASNSAAKIPTQQSVKAYVDALDARSAYTLFDHYADVGNVGTGEDDLYTDTLPAGLLAANGDKVHCLYGGTWKGHASDTRRMRAYFGGSLVIDTTAFATTNDGSFRIDIVAIRVSSSVVRVSVLGGFPAYSALGPLPILFAQDTEVTGLTLSNTQVVKITGEAVADNDIVARMAYAQFIPAA